MRVLLKSDRLILVPGDEAEQSELASWRSMHDGCAFAVVPNSGSGVSLVSLGPRDDACRTPINVTSASPAPIDLIANFAPAPFQLDGVAYACVEAFWQSLRFPVEERCRIAGMDGPSAKRASEERLYSPSVIYAGRSVATGTYEHWQLMRRACKAKFEQNAHARAALLSTGQRPLVHIVRRDSRTIPGVIMADIWMRIRKTLQQRNEESV